MLHVPHFKRRQLNDNVIFLARRPSMPMSMISGFPRQTALRKQSEAQFLSESMHGSKHSIDGIDRNPGGQLDYI
jgi:hypothetical protein